MDDRTVLDSQPASSDYFPLSLSSVDGEEVTTSLEKEGISFIFETRSLSSITRFIYTPIEGTFADIELEINNADPIQPASQGGITIEMAGQEWPAASEEVERRLISCEQIGDCVEARWRWKRGEELADFLYRLRLRNKTLIVDLEGGQSKATGVDLGCVSGALHPRLIAVPYFTFGEGIPCILCTAGVFISSLLDWNFSRASKLLAPSFSEAQQQQRLNGGCVYYPKTDSRRNALHERWLLTVSRQFEEVLPALPATPGHRQEEMKSHLWYNISRLASGEESYIEIYERLRRFKQWGLDKILVNHPGEIWHDGDGNATLTLAAAPGKGGDDALSEYLEAVAELGFPAALYLSFRDLAPVNPHWSLEMASLAADGKPVPSGPGRYLLKPSKAASLAPQHLRALAKKYHQRAVYLADHASSPPWAYNDYDSAAEGAGTFLATYRLQQAIIKSQADNFQGLIVGEGGSHWLYPGLLDGYLARHPGEPLARLPLLVDFDLRYLHPLEMDAGLGTVEEFFGSEIPPGEKHSRSPYLDRYLAITVAYGHAGLFPDPSEWDTAAIVKTYYLLHYLQRHFLGVPVTSIRYHSRGNLLETAEALLAGAHEHSQLLVTYEGGLQIYVNGSWDETWKLECGNSTYLLPPASFLAHGPEGLLVYSADAGRGRIDYARCPDYFYCDARGRRLTIGPLTLDGAAVVLHRKWKIDILPLECRGLVEVHLSHFWADRRLPPLRVLAFRPDEEEPVNLKANMVGTKLSFQPEEEYYRYRITLPEWMVEPGR